MTLIVALLILAGIVLLIVEVVFIPGVTIVGIAGTILALAGVGLSYWAFGSTVGFYTLISTFTAFGVLVYYAFRSNAWDKLALKTSINSKNNEGFLESFALGTEGICLSALRPVGKAEFGGRAVEVTSQEGYVDAGTRVRIKEVSASGIIVEQIV